MSAWLRDCVPVVRAALLYRQGGRFGKLMAIGMVAFAIGVSVLLSFTGLGWWQAIGIGCGGPLALFCGATLLQFVSAAARMNTAAHAALVPRASRLMRRCAVLGWAATMGALVPVALAMPHGLLLMLGAHLSMVALAHSRGGQLEGIAIFLVGDIVVMSFGVQLRDVLEQPGVMAGAWAIGFAWGAFGLPRIFPACGAQSKQAANRGLVNRGLFIQLPGESAEENVRYLRQHSLRPVLFNTWLARDIRTRSPQALMLQALGPGTHRYDLLMPIFLPAFALTVCLAFLPADWVNADGGMQFGGVCFAALYFAMVPGISVYRFLTGMRYNAPEQTLFRLAPLAPRADEINRVLAGQFLRIGLVIWALCTIVLVLVSALYGYSGTALLREVVFMCGALAPVACPLANHAPDRAPAYWRGTIICLLLIGLATGAATQVGAGPLWLALLAVLIGASLWLIAQRWRAMLAAPVAFPARRGHAASMPA